jgi:protein SCO1/2
LAVIRTAPDFTLVTQEGKVLRLGELRGSVLLVGFVFTTCSGSCPATTHRMSAIQKDLAEQKLLAEGKVRLISITLDPARDTPDVLQRYMKLYDADAATWTFLTGAKADVMKTVADWGMWVKPLPNGQLDHPSRVFLVDQQGTIREVYNLDFLKSEWVIDDVRLLLGEGRDPPSPPANRSPP